MHTKANQCDQDHEARSIDSVECWKCSRLAIITPLGIILAAGSIPYIGIGVRWLAWWPILGGVIMAFGLLVLLADGGLLRMSCVGPATATFLFRSRMVKLAALLFTGCAFESWGLGLRFGLFVALQVAIIWALYSASELDG